MYIPGMPTNNQLSSSSSKLPSNISNNNGHKYSLSIENQVMENVSHKVDQFSQDPLSKLSLSIEEAKSQIDHKIEVSVEDSPFEDDCFFESNENTTNPFQKKEEIIVELKVGINNEHQGQVEKLGGTEKEQEGQVEKQEGQVEKQEGQVEKKVGVESEKIKKTENEFIGVQKYSIQYKVLEKFGEHIHPFLEEKNLGYHREILNHQLATELSPKIDSKNALTEEEAINSIVKVLREHQRAGYFTRNGQKLTDQEFEELLGQFRSSFKDHYKNNILSLLIPSQSPKTSNIDEEERKRQLKMGEPEKPSLKEMLYSRVKPIESRDEKEISDHGAITGLVYIFINLTTGLILELIRNAEMRKRLENKEAKKDEERLLAHINATVIRTEINHSEIKNSDIKKFAIKTDILSKDLFRAHSAIKVI